MAGSITTIEGESPRGFSIGNPQPPDPVAKAYRRICCPAQQPLAPAAGGLLDRNTGAELLGQLLLEPLDVRIAARTAAISDPISNSNSPS